LTPKYLYLGIDLLSFTVPFLFTFFRKANFSRAWKYALPAIAGTAFIFIAWNCLFTYWGIWGFNSRYTIGKNLFGLPVEDILFFFSIPFACLFTYFALNQLIEKDYLSPYQELISSIVIVVLLVFGGFYMHHLYTGSVFLFTGLFLAFVWLKLRVRFMGRLYFCFIALLIPFLILNGILTGSFIEEPVVWYNNTENMGLRIGTIPLEDVVYAFLMLLLCVTISEKLEESGY
jgi:lycopene cyclase domain-containing protein